MTIIIKEEDTPRILADLFHITLNMRFWQKFWNEHHGCEAKGRKEYWERKYDEFILAHGIKALESIKSVKVIREF